MRLARLLQFALAAVFLSTVTNAHLLHEQNATMKIVDNSANFVVSVPVSALEGVDGNNDGLLSVAEIEAAQDQIIKQFSDGIEISDGENPRLRALTWVSSPETHNPSTPSDYVVVMQRVFFAEEPKVIAIKFNLFGSSQKSKSLRFRATKGGTVETATLTPDTNQHTFFRSGILPDADMVGKEADNAGIKQMHWLLLGALIAAGGAGLGVRRLMLRDQPLKT